MDEGTWLSNIGHAGRLFIESIPQASWLTYEWAKDWQGLLAGLLLLVAAWIFAQGSLRAARIRAAAMIRSAEIAANVAPHFQAKTVSAQTAARAESRRPPPLSPEGELFQRVEQLRSLIRSAMSTLTSDAGKVSSAPNFYCERITLLRFDDAKLPASLTPAQRELHKKMMQQLAVVRQVAEKKAPQTEVSHALVQLNTRARELSTALAPGANVSAASGPLRKTSPERK